MVEQVDTQDLKSCALTGVPVRFRPGAPVSSRCALLFDSDVTLPEA